MRVALYARVSTKQHGQDVETQLQALRAWAKQKGHKVFAEYADRGWSGAKERRPELDRLMRDAQLRKFDGILVARFDRFARSVKHLIGALETFNGLGIHFGSLTEAIDTSTPMGKMVFTVLGAVAELERSLIKERVQMGVDRARREGKTLGRPRKCVNEEEIFRQAGKRDTTVKGIAREHGLARSTIRAIVARQEAAHAKATKVRGRGGRRKKPETGSEGRRVLRRGRRSSGAKDRKARSEGGVRRTAR